MMDKKIIKETVKIEIDNITIICYILEDDRRFLGQGIRNYFKGNPNIPLYTLIDENNNEIKAFQMKTVVENINSKLLHIFATFGLNWLIDDDLKHSTKREKRNFSEFDRLMQKALNYNPKEKEK